MSNLSPKNYEEETSDISRKRYLLQNNWSEFFKYTTFMKDGPKKGQGTVLNYRRLKRPTTDSCV